MDVETFRWLLTDAGQALLASATEAIAAGEPALSAGARLRRRAEPSRVAAAMSQAELRVHARAKFGDLSGAMYFTRDALEQATRLRVAEHRAGRLRAASTRTLVDLGCGLGGDLIAAARAGITTAGVDNDPLRVEIARANLDGLGLGGAVAVADATAVDTAPFDVAYADPARRTPRGRSFDARDWQPSWDFVSGLLRRDSCVKVAPGIPRDRIPGDVEAEWVSDRGEVKEAALWSGRLASTARRATVLGATGLATLTDDDAPEVRRGDLVRDLGEFLYEPDGAVIRAGLVSAVAAGVHGGLLDDHIAWVTSDRAYVTPFASGYVVRAELPFREKALRAALAERGIGAVTIKTRGVDVVPERLRARLALEGDRPATVVLTRARGKGIALLVDPIAGNAG